MEDDILEKIQQQKARIEELNTAYEWYRKSILPKVGVCLNNCYEVNERMAFTLNELRARLAVIRGE